MGLSYWRKKNGLPTFLTEGKKRRPCVGFVRGAIFLARISLVLFGACPALSGAKTKKVQSWGAVVCGTRLIAGISSA